MGHLVELLESSISRAGVVTRDQRIDRYCRGIRRSACGTGPTENGEIGGRFWAGANYRGMNIESDQRRCIGSVTRWLGSLRVLISGVFIAFAGTATADENIAEQDLKHPPVAIDKFLGQHCRDCHSGDEPEAGLSLTELPFDLNKPHAFESWRRVYERVRDGEMPPDSDLGAERDRRFPERSRIGD